MLERVCNAISAFYREVPNDEKPFALRTMAHITKQYTQAQLVFGQDSILNIRHEANWEIIKKYEQDFINKGNQQENCNLNKYTYNKGDKVLVKNTWKTKYNQDTYLGPYTITAVRNNGTVRACKGKVTDFFNICNITLYKE